MREGEDYWRRSTSNIEGLFNARDRYKASGIDPRKKSRGCKSSGCGVVQRRKFQWKGRGTGCDLKLCYRKRIVPVSWKERVCVCYQPKQLIATTNEKDGQARPHDERGEEAGKGAERRVNGAS